MVYERVKKLFWDIMGIPEEEISLESNLYDGLCADSLDISQIIIQLENDYKIKVEDDVALKLRTVEDIVKYVEGKIS
ncbi:acyl carrier protein [Anaerobacterium chartisolvens]|uniref:Acyl carrier protein n=1 Tax=Anaerobacterium chartisolvens TaxID=1297424 RepID=A0A369BF99_9FIRM|nr:acyl carrier protein [Anaerobacterium chartisolvens]RCX18374.1 acyl carrier protein [Anaerobacterium chartisolvens]